MATAFSYGLNDLSVESLGGLIRVVGPAKLLQENIAGVQAALGTTEDAVSLAKDWVNRSGLLLPVDRSFVNPNVVIGSELGTAVITGGVRNWMMRRSLLLESIVLAAGAPARALLVAGNRIMGASEGDDVEGGMKESDYMNQVYPPQNKYTSFWYHVFE